MKALKIKLMALAAALLLPMTVQAASLTQAESNFRANIFQFLKEEGFSPTIDDEDNSVNFKKEGVLYWIALNGGNVMFVEFHRAGLGMENTDPAAVAEAVNQGNLNIRTAKAWITDSSISFAVEMYCHSVEEFRYVFYSCIDSLDKLRNYIYDYYTNGSGSGSGSSGGNSSSSYSSSRTNSYCDMFFPIYGLSVGVSTYDDLRAAGYKVESSSTSTTSFMSGRGMFFDYDKNGIFEKICVLNSFEMPDKWANLGFSWSMSYNQCFSKLQNLGFTMDYLSEPKVKTKNGRKVLDAMITATSPDGRFVITVTFDNGKNGYSQDSKGTIDNFQMEFK